DWLLGADVTDAEALHVNNGAIAHNGNRCARHLPIFHRGVDVLIERRPASTVLRLHGSRGCKQDETEQKYLPNTEQLVHSGSWCVQFRGLTPLRWHSDIRRIGRSRFILALSTKRELFLRDARYGTPAVWR